MKSHSTRDPGEGEVSAGVTCGAERHVSWPSCVDLSLEENACPGRDWIAFLVGTSANERGV